MTRLNLASGIYVVPGFDNLDPIFDGWTFERGLPYDDGAVEAITVCHGLLAVPLDAWPSAFEEIARVLEPAGVVRVQEDWTNHPGSSRYGGYPGAVTLTTPKLVTDHLRNAGLEPFRVDFETTTFRDRTLIQKLHRGEPHSFAIEARKP